MKMLAFGVVLGAAIVILTVLGTRGLVPTWLWWLLGVLVAIPICLWGFFVLVMRLAFPDGRM